MADVIHQAVRSESEEMLAYRKALGRMDWLYEWADDHQTWAKGNQAKAALMLMQAKLDPHKLIWNIYQPDYTKRMRTSKNPEIDCPHCGLACRNPEITSSQTPMVMVCPKDEGGCDKSYLYLCYTQTIYNKSTMKIDLNELY